MKSQPLKAEEYHMSMQEVAEALGISVHTVNRHQARAFAKMRRYCKMYNIRFNDLVDNLSVVRHHA